MAKKPTTKHEILYCDCHDLGHALRISQDENLKDQVFIEMMVDDRRLWYRIRNLFNYLVKGGNLSVAEVVLNKEGKAKLKKFVAKL